jgi:hypothetical protein
MVRTSAFAPSFSSSFTHFSSRALAIAAAIGLAGSLGACQISQLNGAVITDSAINKSFSFSGYTDHPSEQVVLEVLKTPSSDISVDANWVQFGSATTGTSPIVFAGDTASPLYSWSTTAVPVPAGQDARWPVGGLIRTRARRIDSTGASYVLTTFDAITFGSCVTSHGSDEWTTIGTDCAGTAGKYIAMASDAKSPADLPANQKPDWLGIKGDISTAETQTYYNTWGAPPTLALFKALYGFPANEVTATYFNDGDLGLGREMHCRALGAGVACYVTNYSGTAGQAVFNGNVTTILNDAINHQNSFATVAMVYSGGNTNFVVYNAAGNQNLRAQLDSTGVHQSIPNNCLTCHGIFSNYNSSTHSVSGAKFLAFDPFAFLYSTQAGYTLNDQQEKFRQLNALVKQTGPTPGISQLIDGLYAPNAVTTAGAIASDTYVPPGWNQNSNSVVDVGEYLGFIKPGCRTCHSSSSVPAYDFLESDDFTGALIPTIRQLVCGKTSGTSRGHVMPQAERTSKKLWASGGRSYLMTGFAVSPPDGLEACDP